MKKTLTTGPTPKPDRPLQGPVKPGPSTKPKPKKGRRRG